jgi:hypothetical protein
MQNHNGAEMAQAVNEGYRTSFASNPNGSAFSENAEQDRRLGAVGPAILEFAMNRVHEATLGTGNQTLDFDH